MSQPNSILLAGMDGSALILPAEALALVGLLGGASGLTAAWLLDDGNRTALAAFLHSCGGFRALLLT